MTDAPEPKLRDRPVVRTGFGPVVTGVLLATCVAAIAHPSVGSEPL